MLKRKVELRLYAKALPQYQLQGLIRKSEAETGLTPCPGCHDRSAAPSEFASSSFGSRLFVARQVFAMPELLYSNAFHKGTYKLIELSDAKIARAFESGGE